MTLLERRLYHQGGTVGKKKNEEEEERSKYVNLLAIEALRKADPHSSLNGVMALGVTGKKLVSDASFQNAVPEYKQFTRGDDFSRDPTLISSLPTEDIDELERIAKDARQATRNKAEIDKMKREIVSLEPGSGRRTALSDKIKELETANRAIDPNILQPGLGYWRIPKGSQAIVEMVLRNVTPYELAIWTEGQKEAGRWFRLGGYAREMCGFFVQSGVIQVQDEATGAWEDVGTMQSTDMSDACGGITFDCAHPIFTAAAAAWPEMAESNFAAFTYSKKRTDLRATDD